MGGGNSAGGSSGWQYSTSTPQLFNWQNILPPWVSGAQQQLVPQLMQRAKTGLLPGEERSLWGGAQEQIENATMGAGKNLARTTAASGLSPSSPAVAGGLADIQLGRMSDTAKAALDFEKLKLGAKDTAMGQLLTALYTPAPAAIGNKSTSTGKQVANQLGGK